MRLSITIILLLTCVILLTTAGGDDYEYLNYHGIINKLHNLTEHYPSLMKTESVHEKYDLPHQAGECGNSKCTIYMVKISDYTSTIKKKVQVYLSGNLHGDEQLGPNVLTYLAEYLVTKHNEDPYIQNLLK
jgi:hypothetical protein